MAKDVFKGEGPAPGALYEATYDARNTFIERQKKGRILMRQEDAPVELGRQGRAKWYLNPHIFADTSLQDWFVFTLEGLETHSGKHIHQGGICLFILEGKGYTVVDGERVDWEEGDLVMLPVKPGGVEHQHFNAEPGKRCTWMAFIYLPPHDLVGSGLEQVEVAPEWKERYGEGKAVPK